MPDDEFDEILEVVQEPPKPKWKKVLAIVIVLIIFFASLIVFDRLKGSIGKGIIGSDGNYLGAEGNGSSQDDRIKLCRKDEICFKQQLESCSKATFKREYTLGNMGMMISAEIKGPSGSGCRVMFQSNYTPEDPWILERDAERIKDKSISCLVGEGFSLDCDDESKENPGRQKASGAIPELERTGWILTQNYANRKLEFYYFIPKSVMNNKKDPADALVAVPGIGGDGKQFIRQYADEFISFAEDNRVVLISPSFAYDDRNFDAEASYQFPSVWSGDAILDMVSKVKKQNNLRFDGLYLFGFSAGSQVALRFAQWRPELVYASAGIGLGSYVRIDDLNLVDYFVGIGTKEEQFRFDETKAFCDASRLIQADVACREYEDVGHTLTRQQVRDALGFFEGSAKPVDLASEYLMRLFSIDV